ncbi:MAG TPA: phosphoribosyltransferase family protein [Archangium sp.]|uniref:phosphoribosyltransferase n=1 Tax=Archangium sp. TaxID=1872627 RepID=UPI002E3419F8|nr:phosphoribosyltransferase family protein [Archangium sp.]HEX5751840.1 phosphoribosyltransferase family protein [Archangium sp.]
MATKRATPTKAPPTQATPKGTKGKPSQKQQVEKLVSIPSDMVLAPQVEAPRQLTGRDQSRSNRSVQELSWAEFDRAVQTLARHISQSFKPQAVVGVAHGGVFVGGALSSALGCDFYPVRISRRSRDKGVAKPKLSGEMPRELKGKRVLIVDDVVSSGDTLELATALAQKVGAKEVNTASLVARPGGFAPSFCALPTDALVVFPWDYEAVTEDGRFDVDPDKAGA